MSYKKYTIDIAGMHCRSCEILLDESIGSVRGVRRVRTDHKKGIAEIECDREPKVEDLQAAVESAGYRLGKEEKKSFLSRNPRDYFELAAAGGALFILYLVLRMFGLLDMNANFGSTPGLISVLVIGLVAGMSTCMALIGGLVLGISSRHSELHPEATPAQKFRPHLFFNLGRLLSYIVLGGVAGLIGSAFQLSSSVLGFLIMFLGIVMMVLGLKLVEIFPRLHNQSFTLPAGIARALGFKTETKEYSHRGAFFTGALTFFVPCGFTQAMQLYAVSTGSFVSGAMIMGIFALGTLPGLVGIGGLTSVMRGAPARYFFKFAGVAVIALAIFNMKNGYNLTGIVLAAPGNNARINNSITTNDEEDWKKTLTSVTAGALGQENNETAVNNGGQPAASEANDDLTGKQVIEMIQDRRGYTPRSFTVKKGVPVVWKINSTNQYTCAAYISMPSVGISQPLEAGENVFEFTPAKTGAMKFTCSMGMYSGVFNVVD